MASDLNNVLADGVYSHVAFYNGISIQEVAGREGEDTLGVRNAERTWLVRGSNDPIVCRAALDDGPVAINVYDSMNIKSISRERNGDEGWLFTASYDNVTPEVGGYTISIDTSGGQILQTYGYAQTAFPATGQTATDYGFALDVQDGKPQGVERVIPALKYSIRAKIATEYLGASVIAYSKLVARLTGSVNDAPMFGGEFAAGELLFIGASGELIAENPQLTFNFLASENVSALTIGEITGINKKGHEFMWFDFRQAKDGTTNRNTSLARAAYVGRVYGEADLTLLEIGTDPT